MITVNGKPEDADGITVTALLARTGYTPQQVAVERNEEIVPRAQYDTVMLHDGDTVEIVRFVGGG